MRRKPGRIAAVCAVVMAVTSLAACSENNGTPAQNQQTQSVQTVQSEQSDPAPQSTKSTQSSQKQSEQSKPVSSSSEVSTSSSAAPTSEPQTAPAEGFPEEPSEASVKYFEDAVGIVDKYLSTVMGNDDDAERLGFAELDYNSAEGRQKTVLYLIDCAKKGEDYLAELEKLTPTEEMGAFHNGLVSLMSVMREYSDIAKILENFDVTADDAPDEFNERVEELFERFNEEYKAFYVRYPGFGNALDDGEWRKNGSVTSMYITVNLRENARRDAQRILTAATDWVRSFNDKSAVSNAVLEIYKMKYDCVIIGAEVSETDLEMLKQEIDYQFLLPDEFWAKVYLNADGIPQYVLFSPDSKIDESELNGGSGFESNLLEWDLTGVTPGGHIVGMVGVPPTSEAQ